MRKILLITAFSAITASSFAQTKKTTFGVNAGLNLSSVTIKAVNMGGSANTDHAVGFMVGVFVDIRIADKLSFFPSINFSQKSWSTKFYDNSRQDWPVRTYTATPTLNYLDIPLAIKFQPIPCLDLFAGPQVSMLLSNSTKIKDTATGQTVTYTGKETDIYNTLDLALVTGIGYNFSKFNISARYCPGLTNIAKNTNSDEGSVKINTIQFTAGFRF